MAKADSSRCHPEFVRKALSLANGDKQAAFTRYIQLHYRATGNLAPGCDAKDFQAMADRIVALTKLSLLCSLPLESLQAKFTDWIRQTPLGFWDAMRLCNERVAQGLPLPFIDNDTAAPAGGNGGKE